MTDHSTDQACIVLVAGPVRAAGRAGHHDYAGGCRLLAALIDRVPGVASMVIDQGWPADETVFEQADAVLFYDNGGGKQGFLANAARRACLHELSRRGCGFALLHQAAGFPRAQAALGQDLFGGVYIAGESRRGHWRSRHRHFPAHPVTHDVAGWTLRDGWLNEIRFVDDATDTVSPLVWSDKKHGGAADSGWEAVAGWAYARAGQGRAFVFTGGDNHRVWRHEGLRRLVVGGLLWSAGIAIPGAASPWTHLSNDEIAAYRAPRTSPVPRAIGSLGRRLKRAATGRRKW